MSKSSRPWRKIIRRDSHWSERASLSETSFSWSATPEHKLTLECGHTQIRRGHSDPPKNEVVCKECEAGKETVSIEGVVQGIFDKTRHDPLGARIVQGLAEKEAEKAAEGA